MSERIEKIAESAATKIADWQDKRAKEEFFIHSSTAFAMLKEDIVLAIKEAINELTPEEVHNLCHNLEKTVSLEEFDRGCAKYQTKLFGRCKRNTIDKKEKVN